MKISVVIRAFNEAQHLERLLMGLQMQTEAPHEVILVDSGSTDDTTAIARAYDATVVRIDKSEFTFGRALNRGCAAATGDICVFASGHVFPVHTTWLETLTAPLADERVVLSYGRQRGHEGSKFSEHQLFARWFPAESAIPQSSDFCNNANCAISREMWERVPYDETLTGLEDVAWAKAVRRLGYDVAYVAEAEVVHVHDETWDQVENRYRREAMALRAIDDHRHFTRWDFARLLVANVAADLQSARHHERLRAEAAGIVRFRYHQLTGTYRGFNGPSEASQRLRDRFYYPGEKTAHARDGGGATETRIDYESAEAGARHVRLLRPVDDADSRAAEGG